MSDNPLSTNPILPADAHARYVPWLTDVDREIGCLVRVALQRDCCALWPRFTGA